jgi:uncharacterized membrane protein YqjE
VDAQAGPVPAAGPAESLRGLGSTLVELLGTRAELALVELHEEAERRREMLVLGAVAGFFLALGLLVATLFVIAIFWDTHRLAAIGAIGAFDFAAAGIAFRTLRVRIATSPPPFEATLRELAADRDMLAGRGARADDGVE